MRPARADDYEAFARLFPELGVDDPVPERDVFVERLAPTMSIAEAEAEAGGAVVGYAHHLLLEESCHVRNLVTDPRARRRGIGRALMEHVRTRVKEAGLAKWHLDVKVDNVGAIALYRSLGFSDAHVSTVMRVPWALVSRLAEETATRAGAETPFAIAELAPSDEAAVESKLRVTRGLLAQRRASDYVVRVAWRPRVGDHAVGVAAFDPRFPGVFPFVADDLDVAAGLLAELAPARQTFGDGTWREEAFLVTTDRAAIAEVLVARGASLVFRGLAMEGRP